VIVRCVQVYGWAPTLTEEQPAGIIRVALPD
jgi:hypothetical protein